MGSLVLIAVAVAIYWLEAVYARGCLRRHLDDKGLVLRKARWRPLLPLRQVRFVVEAEHHGHPVKGEARLGGYWTGPVFSRRIELRWDDA